MWRRASAAPAGPRPVPDTGLSAGRMAAVDVVAHLDASCSPERLFAEIEDLARYPSWLTIVPRAVPVDADPDEGGPAWSVDLRGRLGPLARSKRLRMVRTLHEAPRRVRFERREQDGRQHSDWVLEAEIMGSSGPDGPDSPAIDADGGERSRLVMRLHYGGSFGGSLLERMIRDEIERCRPRLLERLTI